VTDGLTRILWTGTVGLDRTLDERIEAASGAGFEALSTSPREAMILDEKGVKLTDAASHARSEGVPLLVLDAVYSWLRPSDAFGASQPTSVEDCLRMASELGVQFINAIAMRRRDDLSTDLIAERFAHLCHLASDIGCKIHLEFEPHSLLPDIASAWEIVRLAGCENGGVLFDSWHFFRGNPDFQALASVPGARIFSCQISDGAAERVGHWSEEMLHHRLLPGDGVFDLTRALRCLSDSGGLTLCGPEVLSDELHALTPTSAARRASERMGALWAQASSREAWSLPLSGESRESRVSREL
jgi:sugar phosphate isomerase/epimerase